MDIQKYERDPTRASTMQKELDTTIPSAHQAKYILNPNYVTIMKQDINMNPFIWFV